MKQTFGYGKNGIELDIPEKNLISVVTANEVLAMRQGAEEVKYALENPITSKRLKDLVKPGESICIVTSDITRPCPSRIMLPPLLDELELAKIKYEDITVVFALGAHRKHTQEEMISLVGAEVFDRIECIDSDPDDVIYLGQTKRGTPINITRSVAEADRIICLGNIELHYFAGYSGGGKALMPGVSNRDAISANHSMMVEETSVAGKLEGNNLRDDIDEAASLCDIDFILNVVLDEEKNIVKAVAGDWIKAHRAGCDFLDSMYKVKIPALADIVIASADGFPKDINLYQAQKALDNAKHAVREGGIIILLAECPEGLGEDVFSAWLDEAKSPGDLIRRIKENFTLGGHKAAAIAMVVEKCREVFLVSAMDKDLAAKTFMKPFDDSDKALKEALQIMGEDASLILMPFAGSTLPNL